MSTLLQHTLTYWIPLSLLQISYCQDTTKPPTIQKALAVFKIQPEKQRQPCKPCYYNNQPWNLQLKTRTKSRRHRTRERKTHRHKDGEILQSRKKRWPTTSRGQQHTAKDLQHAFLVLLHQFTRCCCFFFFPCA
jgi:hypothetical protein